MTPLVKLGALFQKKFRKHGRTYIITYRWNGQHWIAIGERRVGA